MENLLVTLFVEDQGFQNSILIFIYFFLSQDWSLIFSELSFFWQNVWPLRAYRKSLKENWK